MEGTINLETIRNELEEERAALEDQLADVLEKNNSMTNPNRSDLARSYDQLQRNRAIRDRLERNLEQVEAALQRLDNGTYGKCVRCGEDISAERLKALPYAAMCIRCQSLKS